ncbi:DUF4231 domain-containing protein [Lysobacter changpingensis]|uniref:DUF4231 domain-containing protein n=1 Tax=Lysobacter changpingensis TaxID=2792784 RepID=UPI001A8BFBC9|nr:DUF4231 domain-containing protein [Lysobacter changpingensis]
MRDANFPGIYRSADQLSADSQRHFFLALGAHLSMLVIAAALSLITSSSHWVSGAQLIALLAALACSIYLFSKRPDRYWYGGRAVAESVKTLTWRYVARAEPFCVENAAADIDFREKLRGVVNQNREVASALTKYLDERQITEEMKALRSLSLDERKRAYESGRILNQLTWYADKARANRDASTLFFWCLVGVNSLAVVCAIFKFGSAGLGIWPTDVFVAIAASLLGWMQARRFSELASSYALTAHEIGFIREQAFAAETDQEFSAFVSDAENAFSREHTQWIARKDA